jgi:superoxide dismutase, Fe-Mn family
MPSPLTPSTTPASMTPAMLLALAANFGGYERWREAFIAPSSHGAARLVFSPHDGTLHNRHEPARDVREVVLLDMTSPVQVEAIDWPLVYERYQSAVHDASEPFGAAQAEIDAAVVLDVRRAVMFEQATTMIPRAQWRDPACVAEWASTVPRHRAVVVYCVYGHEVGRATALRLRAAGIDARYLRGGIDAWQTCGLPLQLRGVTP